MKENIIGAIAVIGLILAGFGLLSHPASNNGLQKLSPVAFGSTSGNLLAENYMPYILYNGGYTTQKPVAIGATSPSSINNLAFSSCSLISNAFTVTASSTLPMDCAVAAAVSGDIVFGQFATSTANGGGWVIVGASASSTSGYITFRVRNDTGTNAVIPASIASSTMYLDLR